MPFVRQELVVCSGLGSTTASVDETGDVRPSGRALRVPRARAAEWRGRGRGPARARGPAVPRTEVCRCRAAMSRQPGSPRRFALRVYLILCCCFHSGLSRGLSRLAPRAPSRSRVGLLGFPNLPSFFLSRRASETACPKPCSSSVGRHGARATAAVEAVFRGPCARAPGRRAAPPRRHPWADVAGRTPTARAAAAGTEVGVRVRRGAVAASGSGASPPARLSRLASWSERGGAESLKAVVETGAKPGSTFPGCLFPVAPCPTSHAACIVGSLDQCRCRRATPSHG